MKLKLKVAIGLLAAVMSFGVLATEGTSGPGGSTGGQSSSQSAGPSNGSAHASHSQGIENIKSSYVNTTHGKAQEAWAKGRVVTDSVFCHMPKYVGCKK
ncbi:hypothetical protein VR7_gp099 [Escherichia phage vB_EcoM_VR7]|uniref:Uncharacterized protein VR7ORF099c n=1 Tax=Escherichia phage vB_EcoM_VR7 TaxID=700939 RepID=E5FIU2_9CAUD|nr:hypothetical protein VR7_gp099 [Escherichia phage vB_EcoM_VR7]ADR32474.1 hypothetical protein VR7_gp099 [Escherichia phage vB_EcoM_VR7]